MTTAQQIKDVSTNGGKQFSKTYIASLLGYTRKTLYERIKDNKFSAIEIKTLKDKGIIS